jgi:hypothetical protein
MKLWVLRELSRATNEAAPSAMAICMVPATGTPAMAWREKQGALESAVSPEQHPRRRQSPHHPRKRYACKSDCGRANIFHYN